MTASDPGTEMTARRAFGFAGVIGGRLRRRLGVTIVPTRCGVAPAAALAAAGSLVLAACSSHHATFPDVPPDQVWTAMKAAALDPSYSDWIVLENAVAIDETDRTIEIYRQLRRDYVAPGVKARREDEEWKVSVALDVPAPPKAPEAVFTVRDAALPAHAQREANRYFGDVRMLLGLEEPTPRSMRPAPTSGSPATSPSASGPAPTGTGTGAGAGAGAGAALPVTVQPAPSGPPSTGSPQPAGPVAPPLPPPVDLPQ